MAKIWPVYDGKDPTLVEPWARLPLAEAVDIFELRPNDYLSELDSTPRFGSLNRDLRFAGFKHIVVEVDLREVRRTNWKPGFYKSRIKPQEAYGRLIRQAVAAKLGKENVVRVHHEPGTDSQGREALKITVVIVPGTAQRLANGAILDALVGLRERLHEMREDRIPLIEYATEAELEQDASP